MHKQQCQSSKYNGVNLESWYPKTAPMFPSALQWMPYKVVKSVPHVLQPGQGHPLLGALRYHKALGWHYRYSTPFKVTGRPPLPSSMISEGSDSSLASVSKVKRRFKKPRLKINKKAFIKLNKILGSLKYGLGWSIIPLEPLNWNYGGLTNNLVLEASVCC